MKISAAPHIGLLLFLSWFAGFPASAANWKRVADDEKIRVEVDVATLTRDGNTAKARERETHRKPEQAKPGDFYFKSAKTLAQHHCVERTTTYLFRGFYAEDGSEIKTITSGPDLGKVDFLVPDSLEERKLLFACTYSAGKPAKSLPLPAPAEAGPPAPFAEPAKPAEKTLQKDAQPAKSAGKDDKSPVESKLEKVAETRPAAIGKTSAGK